MTLTDFLLSRIAEDEAVAGEVHRVYFDDWSAVLAERRQSLTARVLAECEAKRIVANDLADASGRNLTTEWGKSARHGLEIAARALALPYADHPDYREEWRP